MVYIQKMLNLLCALSMIAFCTPPLSAMENEDSSLNNSLGKSSDIIKKFGGTKTKKSLSPQSTHASKIVFFAIEISNKTLCHRIGKVFKPESSKVFESEKSFFEEFNKTLMPKINQYTKSCQLELPVLSEYVEAIEDENMPPTLQFKQAEGITLHDLDKKIEKDPQAFSKKRLHNIYYTLGKQMANLDKLICHLTKRSDPTITDTTLILRKIIYQLYETDPDGIKEFLIFLKVIPKETRSLFGSIFGKKEVKKLSKEDITIYPYHMENLIEKFKNASIFTEESDLIETLISEFALENTFSQQNEKLNNTVQNLNRAYEQKKKEWLSTPRCQRLPHKDSHFENFMFDEENQQLYWIDYSGSHPTPFPDITPIPDQKTLRFDSRSQLNGFVFLRPWMLKAHNRSKSLSETDQWSEENAKIAQLLKGDLIKLKSFFQGYGQSIAKKQSDIPGLSIIGESVIAQCNLILKGLQKKLVNNKAISEQIKNVFSQEDFSCE